MTDLSPRETAARVMFGQRWTGMTFGRHPDLEDDCRALTDAVLAAVAAHDGLADELRKHRVWGTSGMGVEQVRCSCKGPWMAADGYPAHLADVVRAWMVQT